LVTGSAQMAQVLDLVRRVAPTDATVLIHGESGSGKEVIAKAIHHASQRARGSFVAINCAALPETLLESELFGHVKGAFTGAATNKKGLFEEAHGGTLLLGEVGGRRPRTPAQAPPPAPGGGEPARRLDAVHPHRRARRRRHEPRSRADDPPGWLPRRPLLPAPRDPGDASPAPRAPRGHSAPGRALPGPLRRAAGPRPSPEPRRHGAPPPLP